LVFSIDYNETGDNMTGLGRIIVPHPHFWARKTRNGRERSKSCQSMMEAFFSHT